jgi:hypothetical protein
MADDPTYVYDVFISYSTADRQWAEDWLRPRLEAAGLQVCTDDDFEPGVPRLINIERAVGNSRQAVLILTPAWITSEWSEFAALLSQTADPAARQRRLLPLMLERCQVPSRIGMLTSIDFTRTDKRDKEVQRTIKVVRGELRLPERPLSQEQRNRQRMLQKVRDFWIEGVLENSLQGAALIELGMEYKPDAVQHPWDTVIQNPDQPTRTITPGTKIVEVFDKFGRELLILGAPGSGKTTMLLELTRDLIARAELDESYPIPLVFNLSSWAEKRMPLLEWLVDELNTKYDIPRKIGKVWIDADHLLPLLDGLDEVKQERRPACIEAINAFRRDHGLVNLVVCSRVADYDVLAVRLKLQGAVLIHPLTTEQIDAYLASAGDQLGTLRTALTIDDALRELAAAPLMLSIMTLAYQEVLTSKLATSGTIDVQRKQVFDAYLDRMFARRGRETRYSSMQTLRWLSWLARGMVQRQQTVFFIERLQPTWLSTRMTPWLYNIIDRLGGAVTIGLICGGIVGWVGWIEQERTEPFIVAVSSLAVGLGTALFTGLFGGETIEVGVDQHGLRVLLYNASLGGLVFGLIGGVSSAMSGAMISSAMISNAMIGRLVFVIINSLSALSCGMLAGALAGNPSLSPRQIAIVEVLQWSRSQALVLALCGLLVGEVVVQINGLISNKPISLVFSILIGLGCAIIGGGLGGIVSGEVVSRTMPNQGIWRSARSALLLGLGSGFGVGVICGLCAKVLGGNELGSFLVFGLSCGVVIGLAFGGYACLSHLALRLVLWRNGSIPPNYVSFLDYCAERIFLRKVGGGYIFIHRMLMEYFASLNTSEQEHNAPPSR